MKRISALLALTLTAGFTGHAFAQSTEAPAGDVVISEGAAQDAIAAQAGAQAGNADTLEVLDARETDLSQYLWTRRPIVVLADTPADPRFKEQLALLAARPGPLQERDAVVIFDATPEGRSAIRTKLRPRGFMLVLIGKDGQIKLRKPFPWDVREITQSIDKWPLRLDELSGQ